MSTLSSVSHVTNSQAMQELLAEEVRSTAGSSGVVVTFPKQEETVDTTNMVAEYVMNQMNLKFEALEKRFEKEKEEKDKEITDLKGEVKELKVSNDKLVQANEEKDRKIAAQDKRIESLVEENLEKDRKISDLTITNQMNHLHFDESSSRSAIEKEYDGFMQDMRREAERIRMQRIINAAANKVDRLTARVIELGQKVEEDQVCQVRLEREIEELSEELRRYKKTIIEKLIDFEGSSKSREIMKANMALCGLVGLAARGAVISLYPPAAAPLMIGGVALGAAHVVAAVKNQCIE